MKRSAITILTIFTLVIVMSCEKKKTPSDCMDHNSCDDEYITDVYKEELGTIKKFVISPTTNPENFVYILYDNDNKVLVPCPVLPDSMAIDGISVRFSGKKTSCCHLIAKENWRVGIGCKLDVTSIRKAIP